MESSRTAFSAATQSANGASTGMSTPTDKDNKEEEEVNLEVSNAPIGPVDGQVLTERLVPPERHLAVFGTPRDEAQLGQGAFRHSSLHPSRTETAEREAALVALIVRF
jgi:hypothetical protein